DHFHPDKISLGIRLQSDRPEEPFDRIFRITVNRQTVPQVLDAEGLQVGLAGDEVESDRDEIPLAAADRGVDIVRQGYGVPQQAPVVGYIDQPAATAIGWGDDSADLDDPLLLAPRRVGGDPNADRRDAIPG